MSDYNYEQIRNRVSLWIRKEVLKYLKKQDEIEISKDKIDALIIDFTFEYCLAQLIVSNPLFAPYQFVSFEAMTLDSEKAEKTGVPEMVYFFYDTDESSEKEVVSELETGVQYCSTYVPNLLEKSYFNKQGALNIKKGELRKVVHPNDIKKIEKGAFKNKFRCIGVQSQYLVLKNDAFIIRILPQNFQVK